MKNIIINSFSQNNINNNFPNFDTFLLNIRKYKLYPPPNGSFFEKSRINQYLNFSTLEPILYKGHKAIIGDGSFSKVFLFNHKKTKTKYAIKKMNISVVLNKANNKNIILNEINIQSRICHPNIIQLYNYFRDKNNSNYFLILEYASKGSLFDYIRLKKGLNESNTFYYFIQAVNAIYFLHKNQIIHRDLKPENLLINHDNILKLCDFGWSVYLYNHKRETFCGTVEYMAPEILKNQGYDFSIDVWSLGVLLYELIHSHSPFVEKDLDVNKIENNIVSKELKFKKGVSIECKDLIRKLLAKNAENRIKVKDIYQHSFVLKYINMINGYIKINYINSKNAKNNTNGSADKKMLNTKQNNNLNINLKNENKNDNKLNSDDLLSEFDTIPNEPEPKKIHGNFDKIVRNFTKINLKIEQKNNISKNIFQSIKTRIDKNILQKSIKKSFSLDSYQFKEDIINENKNNIIDKNIQENKYKGKKILMKKLNIDSHYKENNSEIPNIKHQVTLGNTQNTLIENYNNNLIKSNHKKKNNSKIKKIVNVHTATNYSPIKKALINSYNVKSKNKDNNKLKNKKILNNYTSTNINNLSNNNNSSRKVKNISNNKSISFLKSNNNKSSRNLSIYANSNIKNVKNNKKRNLLIKHINTLNKKSNYSFNEINKLNLANNNIQKKLTLNLSNINVINVYNNSSSNDIYSNVCNAPKIIQKISTFFIREKPKSQYIIQHRQNIINSKEKDKMRKNKKNPPSFAKIQKPKVNEKNNSESKRKNSQNILKRKQKVFSSFINKSKEKNRIKSSKNMKLKNNPIPPLNLKVKKNK